MVDSNAQQGKKIQLTPEIATNLFNSEKQRYQAIITQRRKIEKAILKTDKTIFGLDEIKANKDDEMFVNLGSGVYLPAKVTDKKNVKFAVGAEVFLNKSFEDVLKELKQRKENFSKDLKNLQNMEMQSQDNLNKLYGFLMQDKKKKETSQ